MAFLNSLVSWIPPSTPDRKSVYDCRRATNDSTLVLVKSHIRVNELTSIPTVEHERATASSAHDSVESLALNLVESVEDTHVVGGCELLENGATVGAIKISECFTM